MKIELTRIPTDFKGEKCFTHARCAIREDGYGIMTTQPLRLSGSDIFYGMYISETHDGGKSWSALRPSKTMVRRALGGGVEIAMCDVTPLYHKASGKFLGIGHYAMYVNDEAATAPHPRHTLYAVYDEETGDFLPFEQVEMTGDAYYNCGCGSGQCLELANGDLLIPIYHMNKEEARDPWHSCYHASVMRCSFDGAHIICKEVGNAVSVSVPRGICEPSIEKCGDAYFLALRNDLSGYVARSEDGIHLSEPIELVFDDGENVGNYCTQQHWIVSGQTLYMVYTRRGGDNDDIFRHRAPLFIARFDTERMCLVRESERVAVPKRGARLGNFGCQSFSDGSGKICVSEWMQTTAPDCTNWRRCVELGSDNSIFIAHIDFNN